MPGNTKRLHRPMASISTFNKSVFDRRFFVFEISRFLRARSRASAPEDCDRTVHLRADDEKWNAALQCRNACRDVFVWSFVWGHRDTVPKELCRQCRPLSRTSGSYIDIFPFAALHKEIISVSNSTHPRNSGPALLDPSGVRSFR